MTNTENPSNTVAELQQKAQSCLAKSDMVGALAAIGETLIAIGTNSPLDRAKILSNQGYLQAGLEKFPDALASFEEASSLFRTENSPINMAIQIGNMGSVYRDKGDFTHALDLYKQAMEILEQHDFAPALADQHSNIGYAHSQTQDTPKAIEHFTKAREIYTKLGNDQKAEQCKQNIATLSG